MATLKVGFLYPYSGFFPDLKEAFRQGFDLALSEMAPSLTIDATSEFIQMGDVRNVEQGLHKLLFFDKVDIALGIVGNAVIIQCLPLLQRFGIPVLMSNLGAHIPSPDLSGNSLFYNSLHLWKSQWSAGRWAQATYGGQPSINLALYEAGYLLHEAFKLGTASSGAVSVTMNILKNLSGAEDTTPLIDYLDAQRPAHAHILLSGTDAVRFIDLFSASPLRDHIPLTVNPFIAESTQFPLTPGAPELTYTTTWTSALDHASNHLFTEAYEKDYGTVPNAFSLLGYENGLALAVAVASLEGKITKDKLTAALSSAHPSGPRGTIGLSTHPLEAPQAVYRCRLEWPDREGASVNRVVEEVASTPLDDPTFSFYHREISGWQNPYLCV